MTYTDEILSAYLDGELDAAQMSEIEKAVLEDKQLDARLARLQQANDAVRSAYLPLADAEVPQEFIDLVRNRAAAPAAEASTVVEFPKATPRPAGPAPFWPSAIAASVALVLGYSVGLYDPFSGAQNTDFLAAKSISSGDPLYAAFERTASAQRIDLDGTRVAEPVLSFRSVDGRFCRETVVTQGGDQTLLVACRGDTDWDVVLSLRSKAPGAGIDDGYRTASADANAVLDAFLQAQMESDALGADEEAALIDKAWRRPDR